MSDDDTPAILFSDRKADRDGREAPFTREERPHQCPRSCGFVRMDEATQLCECKHCGRTLSAWEYLRGIVTRWNAVTQHSAYLERERRELTAQVEALKKEKRALQASVRGLKLKGID